MPHFESVTSAPDRYLRSDGRFAIVTAQVRRLLVIITQYPAYGIAGRGAHALPVGVPVTA
jgi:hypothetical protein